MMILPDKKDAIHKAWMYRILEGLSDRPELSGILYFKGGTCAAMLGWLDRFSVDLDFDYAGEVSDEGIKRTRADFENMFADTGLSIKDRSKNGIQYFLKYDIPNASDDIILRAGRNTIKIDASFPLFQKSVYEPARLAEIDRVLTCQSKETMFAHKLVAIIDRFEKTGNIAGRDIYDIHHFFLNGFGYNADVIRERRGMEPKRFLAELRDFIEQNVTDTTIREDLSPLLPLEKFQRIRKVLKREVIGLIESEL